MFIARKPPPIPKPQRGGMFVARKPPPIPQPQRGGMFVARKPPPIPKPQRGGMFIARKPPPIRKPQRGGMFVARKPPPISQPQRGGTPPPVPDTMVAWGPILFMPPLRGLALILIGVSINRTPLRSYNSNDSMPAHCFVSRVDYVGLGNPER